MQFYIDTIIIAFAYAAMGWGIFISLKIFNIPDITTDGSFTLGAAIIAVIMPKYGWAVALLLSLCGGFLAGCATGFFHTKLKVNALLSGIITMTALYSINLMIMGRSNIPLLGINDIFSSISIFNDGALDKLIIVVVTLAVLGTLLGLLLTSDYGLSMRATGNSESMIRALGVNTDNQKIIGLGIANAMTAFSGGLVAQSLKFADINMGIGIVIFGLGAVMIGETLAQFFKIKSIVLYLPAVVMGCLIFRFLMAFCLQLGINPNGLKLITALFVLIFVSLPQFKKRFS